MSNCSKFVAIRITQSWFVKGRKCREEGDYHSHGGYEKISESRRGPACFSWDKSLVYISWKNCLLGTRGLCIDRLSDYGVYFKHISCHPGRLRTLRSSWNTFRIPVITNVLTCHLFHGHNLVQNVINSQLFRMNMLKEFRYGISPRINDHFFSVIFLARRCCEISKTTSHMLIDLPRGFASVDIHLI